MPVPRRPIHLLVQDAVGTTPLYHKKNREVRADRRCVRCRCMLARDQLDTWCSPCQRKWNQTPDWINTTRE